MIGQEITAIKDPLYLDEVVITDVQDNTKLNSPNSLTTISDLDKRALDNSATAVAAVPGMFVDASLGDVFSRVFSRGVSLSAEDDIGWYYTSLQEDGLPIVAVQYQQFTPDMFVKPNIGLKRIEVLKGGKSGIIAPNAPGGIINFVSNDAGNSFKAEDIIGFGLHANGKPVLSLQGYANGPIKSSGWFWGYDYSYRYDRGARDIDYKWNDGGSIKARISKRFDKGIFKFGVKYLNDQVNRHIGLAAINWDDPVPAFGHDFNTTSLLPVAFEGGYTDPRDISETLEFNPSNGIQAKELAFNTGVDIQLGSWRLIERLKYSSKNIDWQTAIGGQPLALDNFITYFVSGDMFPAGLVEFSDPSTGQVRALVNNTEAFNVFQGLPPGFEYLSGSLPNDAVMGIASWRKDDSIDELMSDLRLSRKFEKVDLVIGSFYSHSSVSVFTNASFLYNTYEPRPMPLSVRIVNPGDTPRQLSDQNGMSNYGGLFYEHANIDASQFSLYTDLQLELSNKLSGSVGLRYERVGHKGQKDRSAPLQMFGGLDNDPLTSYDNGLLVPTGTDDIDFSYDYLSYSMAANLNISEYAASYARFTAAHKSPELSYYINNFANVPVESAGTVQDIDQFELGFKYFTRETSLTVTGFLSRLSNVPFSDFVFDADNNTIFYTPTQFNKSQSIGLELESNQLITEELGIHLSSTIQRSTLKEFTLYSANETIDVSDDLTLDFSENRAPHNPDFISRVSVFYQSKNILAELIHRYVGGRFANAENSFWLDGFGAFDFDITYDINEKMHVGLHGSNIFNSSGLMNFFGPNEFGSNSNQATKEYISNNPNGSFVVFPILPRTIELTFGVRINK